MNLVYTKDNRTALRQACRDGNFETIKSLVENGADIHAKYDKAIRDASRKGHLEVVKFLITSGAYIHTFDDHTVQLASEYGHLDIVKLLVNEGADIYADDNYAAQLASENGHIEVVKFLITEGADISKIKHDQLLSLSGNNNFIFEIISKGCCLDMTLKNILISKIKTQLVHDINTILNKYNVLILNIRKRIIYSYI